MAPMITVNYIVLVSIAAILGAIFGFFGHFARAHLTYTPEKLFDGGMGADLINDMFSSHSTTFEKHVVGAEWDDNGYWDDASNRNLIYYVASGFVVPIVVGMIFWPDRATLVAMTCQGLLHMRLHPPLC
jgi:hypothetical protein